MAHVSAQISQLHMACLLCFVGGDGANGESTEVSNN